jgi:DNA-binding MarR family transcriptional regulator
MAKIPSRLVDDFLGSAHVFFSAVNDLTEEQLRTISHNRLTFSQLKLLKLVAFTDTHTISEAAAFLRVSRAAASKAVDRLVRRKWLRRSEVETDRRAARLSLTAAGERVLADHQATTKRVLEGIFEQFPPRELRRTASLLDRLSIGVVDLMAEPDRVCLLCGIHFRDKCLMRQLTEQRCFYQQYMAGKEGDPASPETDSRER